MRNIYLFVKEMLFIFVSMIIPLFVWLLYESTSLYNEFGGSARFNSEIAEGIEGFLTTAFFLILPAAIFYWLLLKFFCKKESFDDRKSKLLLMITAAGSIIASLIILNYTSVPEWFSLIPIPVGVFIFLHT